MVRFSRDQFEVTQYLGNMIGRKDKFMQSIACMSQKWRQIRSYLEIPSIVDKAKVFDVELTKEEKELLEITCKIVERLGQADWQMDVVSHLSMKIGRAYKSYEGE